ncbi:hypothetical protein HUK80_04170 [Flavobacterium sp. MAH-1]|uniref:Uncharacterized protein n=1 Tax=Flavobacterium agri TaxID=2743471 RepID=A0A7Y8Y0D2_9FLAO|nr:hypothetical protein [Flavobacterium agri]NUY80080.1 hypothetical protein [Flavobacterium agri]NYA70105.1 hypothetical protein [Flavobacterium agri]
MKRTEEQVIALAKKIITDLDPKALDFDKVEQAKFIPDYKPLRGQDKDKITPSWLVTIRNAFGQVDFLAIADESGEPLHYQNSNTAVFEIEKREDGTYKKSAA